MKFVNKLLLILLNLILFSSQVVTAQENFKVRNNKVIVSEANVTRQMRKLIINYQIDMGDQVSHCFVYLMLSYDGGHTFTETVPFDKLEGDVGLISSSGEKKIVFNIDDDKERLAGKDLIFKVVVGDKINKLEKVYDRKVKVKGKSFLSKGYRGILEFDYGFPVASDYYYEYLSFISITQGYQFNPNFFLGGSFYTSLFGDAAPAIGVALDSRVNFTKSRFSPFIGARFGGTYNEEEDFYFDYGGQLGVRCALKNKIALTFSVIATFGFVECGNIRFCLGLEF